MTDTKPNLTELRQDALKQAAEILDAAMLAKHGPLMLELARIESLANSDKKSHIKTAHKIAVDVALRALGRSYADLEECVRHADEMEKRGMSPWNL